MTLFQTVIKHTDKVLHEKKILSRSDIRTLMSLIWKLGGNQVTAEGSKALLHLRWGYWQYLNDDSRSLLLSIEEAAYADYPELRKWVISQYGKVVMDSGDLSGQTYCTYCSGTGYISCSSCAGYGYHTNFYTRTDWEGNLEFINEQVPCSCSGGRVMCMNCGGSGYA